MLYVPFNVGAMIDTKVNGDSNVTVIEAIVAKSLILLAVNKKHLCCSSSKRYFTQQTAFFT